jgi:hypothetical protein
MYIYINEYTYFFQVCIDIINTDLVNGLELGLRNMVDILIFNPPYVPTPPEEGICICIYINRYIYYDNTSIT